MTTWQFFVAAGAINGFLGVALGAFGAHGLEGKLTDHMMQVWNKAVHYQQIHALALLAIALLIRSMPSPTLRWAGITFLAGIVLFSGSLYILALSNIRILGAITPLGGLGFLAGWVLLAWSAFQNVD